MPPPARRPFRLSDAMILVAGVAAGLAWTMAVRRAVSQWPDFGSWTWRFQRFLNYPAPLASSLAIALLACRILPPRPSLHRVARQPGTAACAAVAALVAFEGFASLLGWAVQAAVAAFAPPPTNPGMVIMRASTAATMGYRLLADGLVVGIAWATLAATRRWRPEPSWVDRAGRLLGAVLLGMSAVAAVWSYAQLH